jgi:hypothetical protein
MDRHSFSIFGQVWVFVGGFSGLVWVSGVVESGH